MNLTKEEKTVRNILINVASKKQLIYYSDLCKTANLRLDMSIPADRGKIGEILGHISRYEHENGRPLISSVVVSRSMEQGDGFFKLAQELGFGNWKKLKNGKMFEYDMINKAHNFWSKQRPQFELYQSMSYQVKLFYG